MRLFWITLALLWLIAFPAVALQSNVATDDATSLARLSRSWADAVDVAPDRDAARKAARQALDLAQEAVRADPRNAQAHLALAIADGKWTDFVDAKTKIALSRQVRSEAERAIALDPKLDLAYHVLGRWHLEVSRVNPLLRFGARLTVGELPPASLDEAVRNLEKAAELAPRTILHHQHLALAYQAQGRRADAAHQWRLVLDLPATEREDEAAKSQARAALGK
jgi:tetratricopeptide (TPR) repeat protein